MARILLCRLMQGLFTIAAVVVLSFLGFHALSSGASMSLDGELHLTRAQLSPSDRRRLAEDQGLDLPLFWNRNVIDAERLVLRSCARVREALDPLDHGSEPDRLPHLAQALADWVRGLANSVDAPLPSALEQEIERVWSQASLRESQRQRLLAVGPEISLLARLGGQTLAYFPMGTRAPGSRNTLRLSDEVLLRVAVYASQSMTHPLPVAAQSVHISDWRTEHRRVFEDQEIHRRVDAYLAALRAGIPESMRAAEAAMADVGGLGARILMPLLLKESDLMKARASSFLRSHFGREDDYRLEERAIVMERENARLLRWWDRHQLRFDPPHVAEDRVFSALTETRFAHWLGRIAAFDLGESTSHFRPVSALLRESLPRTLLLQVPALLLVLLFGVPIGVWAALRRQSSGERAVGYGLLLFSATPRFLMGSFLILVVGRWLPVAGLRDPDMAEQLAAGTVSYWSLGAMLDLLQHLILPIWVLGYGGIVLVARHVRSSMSDVLKSEPILFARVRGIPESQILRRHALRLGLLPVITLVTLMIPGLIGGSVVVEQLFSIPGTGRLMWQAAMEQDIPLAMALVVMGSGLTVICTTAHDMIMALVDPRTRAR